MEDMVVLSSDVEDMDNGFGTMATMGTALPAVDNSQQAEEIKQRKALQIQKLSDALIKIRERIHECEEAEVNFDDEDNSPYIRMELYKKRAIEIYEKLCDITGERKVKKIKFKATRYDEINRELQKLVNGKKEFPDLLDVMRIIEHCNSQYNYRLSAAMCEDVAKDAFVQIGNMLQKRRKRDLYEMVHHYTSNNNDPAHEDAALKSKLDENRRRYGGRLNEVISEFCRRQYRNGDNENVGSFSRNDEKNGRNLQTSEAPTNLEVTSKNVFAQSTSTNVSTTAASSTNIFAQTSTETELREQIPQSKPMDVDESKPMDVDDGIIIIDEDDDNDGVIVLDDDHDDDIIILDDVSR